VPGDTVVHRLWAGTKLLCLAMLSLTASLRPTWTCLALVGAVVATGVLFAHIPFGAIPRLPRWFFLGIGLGGVLSVWSTTPPTIDVYGIELSLGGLEEWARFLVLAVVLVAGAALIGWTTPTGSSRSR
jgi:energy-coupling factor transport system permease protein